MLLVIRLAAIGFSRILDSLYGAFWRVHALGYNSAESENRFGWNLERVVCFCSVGFSFFSTKPNDWLERTSLQWPILCRLGREILTQSINTLSIRSNPQNDRVYPRATAKVIAHYHQRSDGVSWQVKIGLHLFDNCLGQVKIVVMTVINSCCSPCSRCLVNSSLFSRIAMRHRKCETNHLALACNFVRYSPIEFFPQHTQK